MRALPILGRPLLLVPLALAAYATIWRVGFLSDDYNLLERPSAWGFAATGFSRPMAAGAIWLQLALFGPRAAAFHAVSLALHVLNGLLLWVVLRDLGLPARWQAAGAGLFVIAPVHSEAVYWICCQNYLLEASFLLSGAVALQRYRTERAAPWAWATVAAAIGALLCRESAVVVPLVLVALALVDGLDPRRERWLAALPGALLVYLLAYRLRAGSVTAHGSYGLEVGAHVARNLLHFLAACLFLEPFDDRPLVHAIVGLVPGLAPGGLPGGTTSSVAGSGAATASLIALAAAAVAAALLLRGGPAARKGLALFALASVPYLLLRGPLGPYPHRFCYVPALGTTIAIGAGLHRWSVRPGVARLMAPLVVALGALLLAQTALRGLDYRQATRLSERVLEALARAPLEESATYVVHGVPDNVADAYVFRNGLDAAVRLRTGRPGLEVDTSRRDPGTLPGRQDLLLEPVGEGFAVRHVRIPTP